MNLPRQARNASPISTAFVLARSLNWPPDMQMKDIKNFDKDQLLGALGLEETRGAGSTVLRALGLVALGALVGAVGGLLLAPRSGRELREDISRRVKNGTQEALDTARETVHDHATAQT